MLKSTMLDSALLRDIDLKHELALLTGRWFSALDPAEQAAWFAQVRGIDEGDPEESEADRSARHGYWRFQCLHWVKDQLSGDEQRFYDAMLREHGGPELADLNFRTSAGWGHDSPIPLDELEGRPLEEVVEKIRTWKPTDGTGFTYPDIDGLADVFGTYLARDVEAHSSKAELLTGLAPIFAGKFLSRMADAAKERRTIDVDAVLRLCNWVVQQPVESESPAESRRRGRSWRDNWRMARSEAGRFVEYVCTARSDGKATYALEGRREPVWEVVKALCADDPTSNIVENTTERDPRLYDYLHLGINSARGSAVEAALEYARWIAVQLMVRDGDRDVAPGGLGIVPEVRALLDDELRPARRSNEVMAVIGSRINLLHWMDSAWTRAHAHRLFDLESIERERLAEGGWAAWNAFLVWVSVYLPQRNNPVVPELRAQVEFYGTPSAFGIEDGKVSKLFIERCRTDLLAKLRGRKSERSVMLYCYDRGVDLDELRRDEAARALYRAVLDELN
ncbi:MAG TPA: hypothetical protein VD971_01825 [Phycisphaerales bacterium]|nr:hypothetical protein [Phycisphaerales bacterium]